MRFQPLSFSYDKKGDVMYMTVGKPQKAVCVEEPQDILVRINPKTEEVAGVTMLNFSKHFAGGRFKKASLPLRVCFDISALKKSVISAK